MRRHCALWAGVVSAMLTGCAMLPSRNTSYVSAKITAPADARMIADDAASYLTHPLPPARTTLVLDPPPRVQGNVMTPTFEPLFDSCGTKAYVKQSDRIFLFSPHNLFQTQWIS